MTAKSGLRYRDAGVDIDAGNQLVDRIKPDIARTARDGVLGSIGGFGGMFELPLDRYQHCLLYTSPSPRDGLLSRMPSSA